MNARRISLTTVALLLAQACSSSDQGTVPVNEGDGGGHGDASSGTSSGDGSSSSGDAIDAASSGGASGQAANDSGVATDSRASASSGSPGLGSDAADGSAVLGCAGLPLCDDFESATVGSAPNPALWSLLDGSNCGGAGVYSLTIDSTQAHSGTKSVKVVGGDSCGPVMTNTSAFARLADGEVYGRVYLRFSSATPFAHAALMLLGLVPEAGPLGNDSKDYVQLSAETVGGAQGILLWNKNDAPLPQQDQTGAAMTTYPAAGQWTCFEFHTSKKTGGIEAWVNGAPLPGMTYIPGTTPSNPDNQTWQSARPMPMAAVSIGFGLVDFHAGTNTVWFDDVALSGSRVGCP